MLIRCATDYATFLLFVFDEKRIFHVFAKKGCLPGKTFLVAANISLIEQFVSVAKEHIGGGFEAACLDIEWGFSQCFSTSKTLVDLDAVIEKHPCVSKELLTTLYVGIYKHPVPLHSLHSLHCGGYGKWNEASWVKMPELLRKFSYPSHYKLCYLRAWQVAMGHLQQDSKVLLKEKD